MDGLMKQRAKVGMELDKCRTQIIPVDMEYVLYDANVCWRQSQLADIVPYLSALFSSVSTRTLTMHRCPSLKKTVEIGLNTYYSVCDCIKRTSFQYTIQTTALRSSEPPSVVLHRTTVQKPWSYWPVSSIVLTANVWAARPPVHITPSFLDLWSRIASTTSSSRKITLTRVLTIT
jgi:hypothetical protein